MAAGGNLNVQLAAANSGVAAGIGAARAPGKPQAKEAPSQPVLETHGDEEQQDTFTSSSVGSNPSSGTAGAQGPQGQQQPQQQQQNGVQQRHISFDQQPKPGQAKPQTQTAQPQAQPSLLPGQSAGPQGRLPMAPNQLAAWWQATQTRNQPTSSQPPHVAAQLQKQKVMQGMLQYAKNDYNQFVKSNEPDYPPYSRRNLREIISALGGQDDPGLARTRKKQADDQTGGGVQVASAGEPEGYNKFKVTQAVRGLQIVQSYHQPQNQDQPLDLVA
jgi:hypothetical protein